MLHSLHISINKQLSFCGFYLIAHKVLMSQGTESLLIYDSGSLNFSYCTLCYDYN